MDILKLFFNHDQRLDKLAKRNANKTAEEVEATLSDFMKPTPTYSKFYITGTKPDTKKFGLNVLNTFDGIKSSLDSIFRGYKIYTKNGAEESVSAALATLDIGDALVISKTESSFNIEALTLDKESNAGHKKDALRKILETGAMIVYKEQAHHGFDLHVFSKKNIYPDLFEAFKPLVGEDLRFFSINSKRMRSERHFYFETWTLDRPPHGAEEVFAETVI